MRHASHRHQASLLAQAGQAAPYPPVWIPVAKRLDDLTRGALIGMIDTHAQHRVSTCTRLAAVLVLEEDVDGGGWAAVNVRVPATAHIFHEANVAGSKHVPRPITGANLDFAG